MIEQLLSETARNIRGQGDALGRIFDLMEDSYLFMKDLDHRYCRCNEPLWREFGHSCEEEMLGRTDTDYFPPSVAEDYYKHDLRVIRSGKPILNDVWLVPCHHSLRWYKINKLPVFDPACPRGEKTVIGVVGLMIPYEGGGPVPPEFDRLKPALVLAHAHGGTSTTVREMAEECGYSLNQFTRVFRSLFHMRPVEFLMRLRLSRASRLLRHGDKPIAEIAVECGFYDQSSFTKAFRDHFGLTPHRFRICSASGRFSSN